MKALLRTTGTHLAPFDEPVGDALVLGQRLQDAQRAALRRAGLEPVESAPANERYLIYSDRCWFTSEAIRRFVALGKPGRVRLTAEPFLRQTGALQTDAANPELAILEAGQEPGFSAPPLELDLSFKEVPAPSLHPAMAHASQGAMLMSAALIHGVEHWSHLLRVNLLAMLVQAEQYRMDFDAAPIWKKIWMALEVLWRAGGFTEAKLARGLSRIGKGCKIHPTAVVEACELGDGVEVGPFAMVRACRVGDGAKIEAYGHASLSVIGAGARVGDGAMINLCVLLPGAFVSRGDGFQMSVFGKESFVAVGSTFLDLSFGKTIRVEHRGERADSGSHFLGVCLGHRAKVGNGVRVTYGMAIPNDAFLVAGSENLLRRWTETIDGAATVVDGVAVPVQGRQRQ